MFKKVVTYFDKLEDRIRIRLSRKPLLYAVIGAIGVALIWKGVDDMAQYVGLTGPTAFLAGLIILLLTGLLVSFFIGDSIIISGLKREKKLVDRTESEVAMEKASMDYVVAELEHIEGELQDLKKEKDTSHRKIPL